jgi:hypothetical protein
MPRNVRSHQKAEKAGKSSEGKWPCPQIWTLASRFVTELISVVLNHYAVPGKKYIYTCDLLRFDIYNALYTLLQSK